jgi:hypothetical protein
MAKGMVMLVGKKYVENIYTYGWCEKEIATFSSEKKAKDYIKKSRLKRKKKCWNEEWRAFRKGSLLYDCRSARIEKFYTRVPHDPEIK